jgi:hypothetical protein
MCKNCADFDRKKDNKKKRELWLSIENVSFLFDSLINKIEHWKIC